MQRHREALESFQKASESFEKAMQQGREQLRERHGGLRIALRSLGSIQAWIDLEGPGIYALAFQGVSVLL